MKSLSTSLLLAFLAACSSPNKAEKIDTRIQNQGEVSGETVGIKDGNMVIQRKVLMSEELRRLQNETYELDYKIYGSPYGSRGLYGVLKDCKMQVAQKTDGKLLWTEPLERVTEKEDEFKIGIDEKNKLVAVSEEFLKDRIARFQSYKKVLTQRKIEYDNKIDVCQLELESKGGKIE